MVGWKERDSQRSRVYNAERAAMPSQPPMSIADCAAFVADIQRRPWFRTRWGNRTITVVATNGHGGRVYRSDGDIRLGVGTEDDHRLAAGAWGSCGRNPSVRA